MYGVHVTLDNNGYTFNLLRSGKMIKIVFEDHKVLINQQKPSALESWTRERIDGEPDSDGYLYYISAKPIVAYIDDNFLSTSPMTHEDINKWTFVWLSKDEASILKKALKAADSYYYNQDKYWD
jgi:hypothetical protein